jgi:hypothetical protein
MTREQFQRRALQEAIQVLERCDAGGKRAKYIHAAEDPEVKALCERIGYGAVMDAAARAWVLKDPIGAHTCGPAAGAVRQTLMMLRAALKETP